MDYCAVIINVVSLNESVPFVSFCCLIVPSFYHGDETEKDHQSVYFIIVMIRGFETFANSGVPNFAFT